MKRRNSTIAAVFALAAWLALAAAPSAASAASHIEAQYAIARIHSATLEAEINPLGTDTTCQAEYVSQAQFELSGYAGAVPLPCKPEDLGSGTSPVTATVALENLSIDTTYHFRFLAGGEEGEDKTFATFGIRTFALEDKNEAGEPETQAGGRPYELVTEIISNWTVVQREAVSPDAILKDILTELPPGLIGNPTATPRCTERTVEEAKCSGDAQVGMLLAEDYGGVEDNYGAKTRSLYRVPLYNTIPPKGKAARFTSTQLNVSTDAFITAGIRSGSDYGVTAGGYNITELADVVGAIVKLWGVPADPSHDAERHCPVPAGGTEVGCSSHAALKPFLRNPTACSGQPLNATALVDSYQEPGNFVEHSLEMPAITACNKVPFAPKIAARPTTTVADSPTGLHVDLNVPQNEECKEEGGPPVRCATATADLRDVKVVLPKGLLLNPSGANGLTGCSEAELELHGPKPAHCPDTARVGSVEVDSPLIDHPLPGSAYIAKPYANPFNSLLAIYIAVYDPETGIVVKLAGHVEIGEGGQLVTTFDENPQLPFEHFKLDLFGGALAPLRSPATCGAYETTSVLTPYSAPQSGPPAEPGDAYQISQAPGGAPCPASAVEEPHAPSFEAGTETPIAAAFSPFVLHLARRDDSQELKGVNVTLPPGLVGKLAGVADCPAAVLEAAERKSGAEEKASPSCPASSEVGVVNVGAGAGPAPYYVQGHAYLAGPYKGAPLSLAIVTPALAGPFDLGTVVVRTALYVDPETAQITVKSDPIPTELQGIGLDIRSIAVKMSRPDFTLNPTSCEAMSVTGEAISVLGQAAALSNRFQVGECNALGFRPKLALSLRGSTKRAGHPALKAVLTMGPGEANIARAQVTLPHSEFLDQAHIRTICTRVQFAENACPAAAIYGRAKAWTPLLEKPLEGPVYLRASSHELPDLVADLNGQIQIALDGRVDSMNARLRNTFEVVPDAPVSRFELEMQGNAKGLLVNSTNICATKNRAIVDFNGQNGRLWDQEPVVKAKCPKGRKKGHSRHRRH